MILLDEVDAHLDKDNVNLLQNFIGWLNTEFDGKNGRFCPQIIMISHKENAVCNSDSLIGVTRKMYCGPVNGDQDVIKVKPVADDEQDLNEENTLDKYLTAVTFSLNLKDYK